MPYKPTGRPVGRPPKNPQKAPASPPSKTTGAPKEPEATRTPPRDFEAPVAQYRPLPERICTKCWPKGWPLGWTGTGCEHGIWTRRPVP